MLRTGAGVMAAALFLLMSGCNLESRATGETRHETNAVDLGAVETAQVDIRMEAGELRLKGGASKLLEAEFAFNVPEWRPVVDYKADASRGMLSVSQPKSSRNGRFVNAVNEWDLKLNSQLPVAVTANLGAGEATMDLGQMNLSGVDVNIGAGELKMDLRGDPKKSYDVQVKGGVGQATIYLPRNVGISATATGGLGEIKIDGLEKRDGVWVNPERVGAPVTVRVDVKGGVGEIHLVR
jgi:uncharacterized protein DUF2154